MVKTALKLLLVFVEYTESNATLLIKAVDVVDGKRGEASAPTAGGFSQLTVWETAGWTVGRGGCEKGTECLSVSAPLHVERSNHMNPRG